MQDCSLTLKREARTSPCSLDIWSDCDLIGFFHVFRPVVCLEVGSGSGVVSAFLASVTGPEAFYLWVWRVTIYDWLNHFNITSFTCVIHVCCVSPASPQWHKSLQWLIRLWLCRKPLWNVKFHHSFLVRYNLKWFLNCTNVSGRSIYMNVENHIASHICVHTATLQ